MVSHTTHIRVRYGETDKMGYLYYGNYATYHEVGRVELIRSLGMTYKSMEDEHGILMPVMNMEMRFVRPAHYDELLSVTTEVREMPEKTIVFRTEIRNEKNKLVNGGRIKLCFISAETGKNVGVPDFLREKLTPYFEATQD